MNERFEEKLRKVYQFNRGHNVEGLEDLELSLGISFIETICIELKPDTKKRVLMIHQGEGEDCRDVKLRILARMFKQAILNETMSIDGAVNWMIDKGELLDGESIAQLQNDNMF